MGSACIVEVDPVSDCSSLMLQAFEAMSMRALLFVSPDHALDHFDLLRTVWRDELLFEAITSDETGVIVARKYEDIIGSQQERVLNLTERTVASDESLLKSSTCS